ncbi:sigma-70 family RNA polymerase sigma factor [Fulvivirgaceae bacterium PWU4]|uniref:Sigma-70 family RNA polymerase sigma factor n=1 Tax=Chryseosolibacter histidini TaxID=2782349 RepID=A0AAP2DMD1_9BACT|nr:sigma-70 family RNA polymerase sigma factor [Chryseosolibacter histidini]MBT1697918.1 sigma-70 family RNA polymerase sigma factor [Chryseosolibacter histidini]
MPHLFRNVSNRFSLLFSRRTESSGTSHGAGITVDNDISEAIVCAFSHGSEPAFRQIYDRYAPAIYRVVQRYFQSSALAEELVEELFSTLWRERGLYSDVVQLRSWLFISARNLAIHYLEKMTVEMLSASTAQQNVSNETTSVLKTAVPPVNMLQHPLKSA